ncbi:hypothetical protein C1645_821163 [Glomus cerebriforme]|uniref:F-box domain-containing protein n=1 Tax=Glomus cerebriforme TaxID=658196 RepID=A0A397T5A0_9GLOM|nr:hypothetical protein C1645_821163 [Glomus cerebriforme]
MAIKILSNENLQEIFDNIEDNNTLFSNYFTEQERTELNLQDIPTKTIFEYGWFIQQIDIPILYNLVDYYNNYYTYNLKKYFRVIIKNIFMKTKGLEELRFSHSNDMDYIMELTLALPRSQMLLSQITKVNFNIMHCSPFLELSNYVKNIKYLIITFTCINRNMDENIITLNIFKDLIKLISVQNNLEYFDIKVVNNVSEWKMTKWRQIFFELSKYSSHSIKYLKIEGCFDQEQTDLNFLSYCSNLEEFHLDSMIIDYDQMNCLKDIYLPKLFSFSFLDCWITSVLKSNTSKKVWIDFISEFLKNHASTLKEIKLVHSKKSYLISFYNTISFYCVNLTMLGLKLDHIFGYYKNDNKNHEVVLKEFKSVCSNCLKLKKIILFFSKYIYKIPDELMLQFIQSLPNSIAFLSFEGLIELDIIKEILRINYNLINLDFYYYTCADTLEEEINEEKGRKLKLWFDKKRISIHWTSIYKYFLNLL